MYDAIIVGARVAGSPLAMLLAQKGHKVLLVDRVAFPSNTLSSHFIHPTGVSYLAKWGLLEKVLADAKCAPIGKGSLDFGPYALRGTPPPVDGNSNAYAPRRIGLDKILLDAAIAAGAEFRERFAVEELLTDNGRVIGVRGRMPGGKMVEERARIVIGADGHNSMIAKTVEAPEYNRIEATATNFFSYWSGVPVDGYELYSRDHRFMVVFPSNDGLTVIAVGWPTVEFPQFHADPEGSYMKTIELAPGLLERVKSGGARREEKLTGTRGSANFLRKPYGPGWALVGDAGYNKDPITAQGITDAYRDATLLADACHQVFTGGDSQAPLAAYEKERNRTVLEPDGIDPSKKYMFKSIYEMTCDIAELHPTPPERKRFFRSLRNNPAEADRFFGTIAGSVGVPEYFNWPNLDRIIEQAERENPWVFDVNATGPTP